MNLLTILPYKHSWLKLLKEEIQQKKTYFTVQSFLITLEN